MTNSKTDAAGINADNIMKPTLEKLSEDQRQGLEAWKKKRDEEFEAMQAKRDQEDQDLYLSSFKVDRQGVILPIKEPEFVPLNANIDKPAVSSSLFFLRTDSRNSISCFARHCQCLRSYART